MSINPIREKPRLLTKFNLDTNNGKYIPSSQKNSESNLAGKVACSPSYFSRTSNTSTLKSGDQPKSIMKKFSPKLRNSKSVTSSYENKKHFSKLFSSEIIDENKKINHQNSVAVKQVISNNTPKKTKRNHVSFEDIEELKSNKSFSPNHLKNDSQERSLNEETQKKPSKTVNPETSAHKISKDCCIVYRKKDTSSAEKEKLLNEIRVKKLENSKYKRLVHDIINKIFGIKLKLASKESPLMQGQSFSHSLDQISMFDLQFKVIEDLDIISSLTEKILLDLSEFKEVRDREQQLREDLEEAFERENFLKSKIDSEKNKSFELASLKIEYERDLDKINLNFNREKSEYLQKIEDREIDLLKISKEKEELLKNLNELRTKNSVLNELIKKHENESKKHFETEELLKKEIDIFKEKLTSKICTEELLTLKLKSYGFSQEKDPLIEKIAELEETVIQKNSEISELKNRKFKDRLQGTYFSQSADFQQEKLVYSQEREIKRLKTSLKLLQKENSILILSKDKPSSGQNSLQGSLEDSENRIKLLISENKRLKSELFEALDYSENNQSSKQAVGSIELEGNRSEQLKKPKEKLVEELQQAKQKIEIKEGQVKKMRNILVDLKSQVIQKDFEIDTLSSKLTQVKTYLASKELELSYQQEKETKFKEQINEYMSEIRQINGEVSKIKEQNFDLSQEVIKKDYQIEELNRKTLVLQEEVLKKSGELEKIEKEQEGLLKEINKEKNSIELKQLKTEEECRNLEQENKKLTEQIIILQKSLKEKDIELSIYLDQEKKILNEIEEEVKKQPRKNTLKPSDEIKLANEEKFRLKSLLIYKDTQIKILKDKVSNFRNEHDIKPLRKHNSLLIFKEKK